ncbi:MAG TPA: hypothetical protein VJ023_15060 [Pyrinomonadaceae bacterium]|nr:hypothetical protein [Pyrinomonadaceae bacterium]
MQLLFAPVWGLWSDRVGRKPLVIMPEESTKIVLRVDNLRTIKCKAETLREELQEMTVAEKGTQALTAEDVDKMNT